MALSIKNKKVEEKARRLAILTGKPITEALSDSLDLSLLRQSAVQKPTAKEQLWAKVREIQREYAALPDKDNRTADEILGYNEFGHFD
ncbi:MAG: type II toxin-antitoxin system VapB family antitoxin [Aestuariivirga sp.]|jgi:antitoxin VapB